MVRIAARLELRDGITQIGLRCEPNVAGLPFGRGDRVERLLFASPADARVRS